jgi:hypothetical protein
MVRVKVLEDVNVRGPTVGRWRRSIPAGNNHSKTMLIGELAALCLHNNSKMHFKQLAQ